MTKPLKLYEEYNRKDVHDIFAPEANFTPGAGIWGLSGVVPIPERDNDYAFFVTYGAAQSGHEFDEGITEDGVLSWQSQPSQGLQEKRIRKWINHNEDIDNIYLFLRRRKGDAYTYLGRLGYITHDSERERPVWFQFQILDFKIPDQLSWVFTGDGEVTPDRPPKDDEDVLPVYRLTHVEKLDPSREPSSTTREFQTIKNANFADKDARNRQLGLLGERLVLQNEIEKLVDAGRSDLAESIIHVSVVEGDGAGYDIRSFNNDGSVAHIEVKATKGSIRTPFFISANELAFAKAHPASFRLVRVFDFDAKTMSGSFYEVCGDVSTELNLEPISYKVRV